ncbi:FRG domain-containing protein [Flavobacterium sp. fv08]|uniref:FRG domain-containing protein n=1 Tax=Flavobacterium sp. fv08 TaxID=1761784 RepID=UPI0008B0F447|nr:FRG domain-containing protein [Flavobacterium sp. fv08]SEP05657.1 FRG domain-containing protein [Flavobacterium sp. fv08]
MALQEEFKIKVQLTNEYLRTGEGVKKVLDPNLLQDLIDFREDSDATYTPRLRAFMNTIYNSNLIPPYVGNDVMPEYKSLLQKSLFFDQRQINTEAEFDEMYEKFRAAVGILFRGQREASWRLYNKLQRFWISDGLEDKGWSMEGLLKKLAAEGTREFEPAILELLNEHNIDVVNDLSVLGYLQHHGCPTPLMDWTYSFASALYFGLDFLEENKGAREIDDYFSVYHIEEKDLASMRSLMEEIFEEQGREKALQAIAAIAENEEHRLEMEEHFKGRSLFDLNRVFGSGLIRYLTAVRHLVGFDLMYFSDKDAEQGFIFSLNNSKNILNQQGVFVLNANPFKPLEVAAADSWIDENPQDVHNYRFCECVNIKKSLTPYIKQRLEADGITKDYIYPAPDIDSWNIYSSSIAEGPGE